MEEEGSTREEVLELLENLAREDASYASGRVLSSMCTSPHPLAREVFMRFLESNLGDTGIFRGSKQIEELAVKEIGGLLGCGEASGFIVSGGTEANLLALWVARELSKKREVIVPESAHFSFDKAAGVLGLRLVRARVGKGGSVEAEDVERRLSSRTSAIVGVAGSTEYGAVDNMASLARIAEEENIHLHVDAAFGGFVIPFLRELGYSLPEFDFSLAGVSSITVDPHKMGLVPVPTGCILFRKAWQLRSIESIAPYLIERRQYTLLGTRTGAGAASALAMLKHLGKKGYREVVKQCMEVTEHLYSKIASLGFKVLEPKMNLLVFSPPQVEEVARRLSARGWRISRTRRGELRLVIMPHVTFEKAEEFIEDLKDIA